MKVEIRFTEPLLGTLSGNKDIAEEFIVSKHPDGPQEEELHAERMKEMLKNHRRFFREKTVSRFYGITRLKGFLKMPVVCSKEFLEPKAVSLRHTKR